MRYFTRRSTEVSRSSTEVSVELRETSVDLRVKRSLRIPQTFGMSTEWVRIHLGIGATL